VHGSWVVSHGVIQAYTLAFGADLGDKAKVDLLDSMKRAFLGIHGLWYLGNVVGMDNPRLLADSLEGQDRNILT